MRKELKYLLIVLVIVGLGLYHLNQRNKEELRKKKELAHIAKIKRSIHLLIYKTNADIKWFKELSPNNPIFLGALHNYELEKLWVKKQPIFFWGTLEDIKRINSHEYTIIITPCIQSASFLATDVDLKLKCPAELIKNYIHPQEDLENYFYCFAVVAKIYEIKTIPVGSEDGLRYLKRAIGECIALKRFGIDDILKIDPYEG